MKNIVTTIILVLAVLVSGCAVQEKTSDASVFSYETQRLTEARPWTAKAFLNDPKDFQFVIVGDRTGGANAQKTFQHAMPQINLLQPEFVINVGDLIEGYSDQVTELNTEWNEVDSWLGELDMPFFKTPGNHDIANKTAREVWLKRYGATYYSFLYNDVLFMVLDTEYNRPSPPPGMKEKIEQYNRLQVEDPAKAQAMLGEFMSDESVVAGLATPVEFDEKQLAWIKQTLADHPDVRWTFLFMHEPCWEK
ncbi:MAG: metallophosphoesterase, partial [Thiohalomonadales bacterium]|nr:metallophosphoesterase [Thiohalomonadales bacterium]